MRLQPSRYPMNSSKPAPSNSNVDCLSREGCLQVFCFPPISRSYAHLHSHPYSHPHSHRHPKPLIHPAPPARPPGGGLDEFIWGFTDVFLSIWIIVWLQINKICFEPAQANFLSSSIRIQMQLKNKSALSQVRTISFHSQLEFDRTSTEICSN